MRTSTRFRRGARVALYLAGAGYFVVSLDVTIVNVALADIGSGLGASRSELQWVVDAYALILASCMLGAGDLADRLGSRRLLIAGLAIFGLASAACAVAPSAAVLIGARAIEGLGAAAILPATLALVNQLFPDPAERPRAIGVWAGIGGSALVAGPILGGLLVGPLGWRTIFWINLPLTAAEIALARAFLPRSPVAAGHRFDPPGQVLGTVALAALVFALIESGRAGITSGPALAGALSALLAGIAFLAVERRREAPMVDPRWFRRRAFSGANLGSWLMNLGTLGALFSLSLFLQLSHGLSPLRAGLNIVPLAAPLPLLTPFTGRLVAAVGPRRPAGWGLLACGCGYFCVAALGSGVQGPAGWAALALSGTGMAVATPGLVTGATEALGPNRAGIASAINNTSRQVGGAIGVALIGGVSSFAVALTVAGAALLLGGAAALVLMRAPRRARGAKPIPRRGSLRRDRCPAAPPR